MKCIVRRLSESVNNETLPVLRDIQVKNYAMASEPKQYVDIVKAFQGLGYNELKINIVAISSAGNINSYMWATNSYISIDQVASDESITLRASYAGVSTKAIINSFSEQNITLDGYNKKITINGFEESRDNISSSTPSSVCVLGFPTTSLATINQVKLKKVEIVMGNTNEVLASIVPAVYNGTPCLYDVINNVAYYANSGEIIVE